MRHGAGGHDRIWWGAFGICLSLAVALLLVSCGGSKSSRTTGATVQSGQDGHGEGPVANASNNSEAEANDVDQGSHVSANSSNIDCDAGDATANVNSFAPIVNGSFSQVAIAVSSNDCGNSNASSDQNSTID